MKKTTATATATGIRVYVDAISGLEKQFLHKELFMNRHLRNSRTPLNRVNMKFINETKHSLFRSRQNPTQTTTTTNTHTAFYSRTPFSFAHLRITRTMNSACGLVLPLPARVGSARSMATMSRSTSRVSLPATTCWNTPCLLFGCLFVVSLQGVKIGSEATTADRAILFQHISQREREKNRERER